MTLFPQWISNRKLIKQVVIGKKTSYKKIPPPNFFLHLLSLFMNRKESTNLYHKIELDKEISALRVWCIRHHKISMNIRGCINTTRNVLAVGCSLICALGFITFSIGLASHLSSKIMAALAIPTIASFPTWLMVFGLLIFSINALAVVGIAMLNTRIIMLFVILLSIIFTAQVVLGIVAYAEREHLPVVASYAWTISSNVTRIYFEKTFNCCGYYNASDRAEPDVIKGVCTKNNTVIPPSSYSSSPSTFSSIIIYPQQVYSIVGCEQEIFGTTSKLLLKIFICALSAAFLEFAILVATVLLMIRIKYVNKQYHRLVEIEGGEEEVPATFIIEDDESNTNKKP